LLHQKVKTEDGNFLDVNTLNIRQLQSLCTQIGIKHVNHQTKFGCRKAIKILAGFIKQREKDRLPLVLVENLTANIMRMTNIVFHSDFVDDFLALNDKKAREEHEFKKMPNDFWKSVYQSIMSSKTDALATVIGDEGPYADNSKEVDLWDFNEIPHEGIRKKTIYFYSYTEP